MKRMLRSELFFIRGGEDTGGTGQETDGKPPQQEMPAVKHPID
jgi:hypothetical protein